MTGALHSRLFQTSAASALAVIIIALGYLGTRGQPPTQNPPAEKLSIAIPITPHAALLHIAVTKGYFAEEGLEVTTMPTIHGKAAIELVVQGNADLGAASDVVFVLSAAKARRRADQAPSGGDPDVVQILPHLHLDALLAVQPERVTVLR